MLHLSNDSSGISKKNVSFVFNELQSNTNRKKIAITQSDGLTQCFVEIEKWDTANSQAWTWTKVPSISNTTDTILYLYYDKNQADNTNYVGDTGSTAARNVWDSGFVGVWHLGETSGGANAINDSTLNNNAGTDYGNPTLNANGLAGQAISFDGIDDFISVTNSQSLQFINSLTIEAWIKLSSFGVGSDVDPILRKGEGNPNDYQLAVNDQKLGLMIEENDGAGLNSISSLSPSTWSYVSGTWNGATRIVYLNGSQSALGAKTGSIVPDTRAIYIGGRSGTDLSTGIIDEVRASNSTRNASWIAASFESERDHILDFGTEETTQSYDYVGNISNIDSSSDKGTHSNFTEQTYGPDSTYDTLTEADTNGAIAKVGTDTSGTGNALTLSFSHTLVAGSTRLVIVCFGSEHNGITVSGVTYGGNTMTLAVSFETPASGTKFLSQIWYILEANLPANGAKTVTITATGSTTGLEVNAFCSEYTGVMQGAPEATTGVSQTSGNTIINTVSPSTDAWVISAAGAGNVGSWTHGSSQVEVLDFNDASSCFAVAELRGASSQTSLSSTYTGTVNRLVRVSASFTKALNYELDLEVQWTNVDFNEANEELCIFGGTMGSENIRVDVWTGSSWQNVIASLTNGWKNVTVSAYLVSSTFTIRFKGTNESGDPTQDSWNIDSTLLNVWTGTTYDYVLKVVNQASNAWNVSLGVYSSSNIGRVSSTTIGFHDGSLSDQIIVNNGVITQSQGALYNLYGNATIYISINNVITNQTGTSYLYVYLRILVPNTSTSNLRVVSFEIS